ncbi:MAG: hypothetical protein H5T98_05600 [Syntrophomonadaceae bacterium]|nr:hypothetical protein [Syntrophomonadaceae bacterium]
MEDKNNKKLEDIFFLPSTIVGSKEWKELEKKEYELGPDNLLEKIISQKLWSNVEIVWVLKRLIFFYGKKDSLLKKAPIDRLFDNMVDILRVFYLLFDKLDPDIEDNMRAYICSKLTDSTWGITPRTRNYLHKIED